MVNPNSDNQRKFITRIREALGQSPTHPRRPPPGLFPDLPSAHSRSRMASVAERSTEERLGLLKRLGEAARPLQIQVTAVSGLSEARAAIVDLVDRIQPEWDGQKRVAAWRHPLIDRLKLEVALDAAGVPVTVTEPPSDTLDRKAADAFRSRIRNGVARSAVGITAADFCVADTATLVLKARPGCDRSVSLLPTVHVAVGTLDQLLKDLGELYAVLRWETGDSPSNLSHCVTMISGPSKTGDIEAVMVPGVHGPRELYFLVVRGT